ncbi:MAG: hypothetical protein WBA53_03070 [Burkholderiaceae bacterium]
MDADVPQRTTLDRLRLNPKKRRFAPLSRVSFGGRRRHDALPQQCTPLERTMQRTLDEVLSRVIRESGSWNAAQRRIRIEHGAAVVSLAAEIALRERGRPWLSGERPTWSTARR